MWYCESVVWSCPDAWDRWFLSVGVRRVTHHEWSVTGKKRDFEEEKGDKKTTSFCKRALSRHTLLTQTVPCRTSLVLFHRPVSPGLVHHNQSVAAMTSPYQATLVLLLSEVSLRSFLLQLQERQNTLLRFIVPLVHGWLVAYVSWRKWLVCCNVEAILVCHYQVDRSIESTNIILIFGQYSSACHPLEYLSHRYPSCSSVTERGGVQTPQNSTEIHINTAQNNMENRKPHSLPRKYTRLKSFLVVAIVNIDKKSKFLFVKS